MRALSDLVRSMNCYYSNLIEGHNTIDRHRTGAEERLQQRPKKRDLQLEAKAHIAVQLWIDQGGSKDALRRMTHRGKPIGASARTWEDLLWVGEEGSAERLRSSLARSDRDVRVGRHFAVSPGAVRAFCAASRKPMPAWQTRCGPRGGQRASSPALGSSLHRWQRLGRPTDGPRHAARGAGTGGLWSVARGLARNEARYKQHLGACDLPRRNDLDGRGHLSEEACRP